MQTLGKGRVLDKAGQEVTQAAPTCTDPLASASRVLGLEETHHHIWFILQPFKSKEIYLVLYSPKSEITKATKQRECLLKSVPKGHSALLRK